jgi:hypothetical protein
MADREGVAQPAARWRALAGRISEALNARLWDEHRGAYADALLPDGAQSRRVSQHANAMLIAAGIAPRERWDRMLDYVMDTSRLVETSTSMAPVDGGFDEETQVVLAQPFFMHHVHRALVAAGRFDEMVANVRERWSPMLEGTIGDATLWEHWHGRESRCHAWSATPAYDLSREVLGVRPLAPGAVRFRIEPHVAGLSWARGRYPTPAGDIGVSWRVEGRRFRLAVEVPHRTVAEVALPSGRVVANVVAGPHAFESEM